MAKAASGIDQNVLAAYDVMIAGVPGVERKGATLPYTSINGNMYSSISKANVIGLRLNKADLAVFLEIYGAKRHEGVPGFIQKDYASIPPELLSDTATLQAWFRKSHAHASSLKPKTTTRSPGR